MTILKSIQCLSCRWTFGWSVSIQRCSSTAPAVLHRRHQKIYTRKRGSRILDLEKTRGEFLLNQQLIWKEEITFRVRTTEYWHIFDVVVLRKMALTSWWRGHTGDLTNTISPTQLKLLKSDEKNANHTEHQQNAGAFQVSRDTGLLRWRQQCCRTSAAKLLILCKRNKSKLDAFFFHLFKQSDFRLAISGFHF